MNSHFARCLAIAFLSFVPASHASEEDFLRWRSVQIDCFETPPTGRVEVKAQVGGKGVSSFSASAFGHRYVLDGSDVLKIAAFPLDSLKATHGAARRDGEGHSVYLRLGRSYYDKEQKLHREEALITLTKGAGAVVSLREIDGVATAKPGDQAGWKDRFSLLTSGLSRVDAEREIEKIRGVRSTYDPYAMDTNSSVAYRLDLQTILLARYKPGAPAPRVVDSNGKSSHLPPIDGSLVEYEVIRLK